MDRIPVIVAGQEPRWLRKSFLALVRGQGVEAEFPFLARCPKGVGVCIVVTDDLCRAGLRQLLFECVTRVRGDRVLVFAWGVPGNAVELLRIPLLRLYFPVHDPSGSVWALRALTSQARPPRLTIALRSALPGSLALGLRMVLHRSADPVGPPPPRRIIDLANLVPCEPETLYRSAAAWEIDLKRVLRLSCIRWLRLNVTEGTGSRSRLASALGYGAVRSLHRFVLSESGRRFSELRLLPLSRIDSEIAAALEAVSSALAPEP